MAEKKKRTWLVIIIVAIFICAIVLAGGGITYYLFRSGRLATVSRVTTGSFEPEPTFSIDLEKLYKAENEHPDKYKTTIEYTDNIKKTKATVDLEIIKVFQAENVIFKGEESKGDKLIFLVELRNKSDSQDSLIPQRLNRFSLKQKDKLIGRIGYFLEGDVYPFIEEIKPGQHERALIIIFLQEKIKQENLDNYRFFIVGGTAEVWKYENEINLDGLKIEKIE